MRDSVSNNDHTTSFYGTLLMTFLGVAGIIHGVLLKRMPPYTMTIKGNSIPQGAMNPEITTLKEALAGGAPGPSVFSLFLCHPGVSA